MVRSVQFLTLTLIFLLPVVDCRLEDILHEKGAHRSQMGDLRNENWRKEDNIWFSLTRRYTVVLMSAFAGSLSQYTEFLKECRSVFQSEEMHRRTPETKLQVYKKVLNQASDVGKCLDIFLAMLNRDGRVPGDLNWFNLEHDEKDFRFRCLQRPVEVESEL